MKDRCAIRLARGLAGGGLLLLALALPAPASAIEHKLEAADGARGALFGLSVAIEGETTVVGAPDANAGTGAVYVFVRGVDSWIQTAKLTASDAAVGDRFGFSVAVGGDTIVAGAPSDDIGATADQGSAYTFARTGAAARNETAKLTASDGAVGDRFGFSVAVGGDTIVFGAPSDDIGATADQGSAYTFARTGAAARNETAKLTASGGLATDELGHAIAIDGDTIVAGVPHDDVGGKIDEGSVYTFASAGAAARNETGRLTASNSAAFGWSVAIDGDTIVAGAPSEGAGATADRGSAYTFARTGAAVRGPNAKLTASDGAAGDLLGLSVAIDQSTIVAGAPLDDVGASADQGCAFVFARTGPAVRSQAAKLTAWAGAAFDEIGSSVAIDGGTIVAGAPFDDVGSNTNEGSASIFQGPRVGLPCPPPPRYPTPPVGPAQAGACANTKRGTSGADTLVGGPGGDQLLGFGGKDLLSGLAGDDCLFGGSGGDRLLGASGNDRLRGDSGNDAAFGGSGRDRLLGLGGSDRLGGGSGNDRLGGGRGHDRLSGNGGNDRLGGDAGNDRLTGGTGNDRLSGGRGRNRYSAGSGKDSVNARNRRRERVDCGPGRDKATVDHSDRVRHCERVRRR